KMLIENLFYHFNKIYENLYIEKYHPFSPNIFILDYDKYSKHVSEIYPYYGDKFVRNNYCKFLWNLLDLHTIYQDKIIRYYTLDNKYKTYIDVAYPYLKRIHNG